MCIKDFQLWLSKAKDLTSFQLQRTDGNPVYVTLARQLHIVHQPVNISAGIWVLDETFLIQSVNAYDNYITLILIGEILWEH